MEIRDNEQLCIYAPLSKKLTSYESDRLYSEIISEKRRVGIDLYYVYDCTVEFIERIKEISQKKKVGIFNIPSDIFALFNIMELDKCADLYVSELDFAENSRQLLNRRFTIV